MTVEKRRAWGFKKKHNCFKILILIKHILCIRSKKQKILSYTLFAPSLKKKVLHNSSYSGILRGSNLKNTNFRLQDIVLFQSTIFETVLATEKNILETICKISILNTSYFSSINTGTQEYLREQRPSPIKSFQDSYVHNQSNLLYIVLYTQLIIRFGRTLIKRILFFIHSSTQCIQNFRELVRSHYNIINQNLSKIQATLQSTLQIFVFAITILFYTLKFFSFYTLLPVNFQVYCSPTTHPLAA